ncbi:MAG: LysR family transcriptional regulator [Xanthobacteraceae bacterium]|nr:MAG: LysR family transcriptional regulator [Xanthobacteraceae bacterium]
MPDRLTGMEVFSKIAAVGSLSAAARALGLSQTMVTKHVAALETHLGVRLLHRTTRRLTLTEAGRRYLESCDRILADIADAESAAAADRIEPRGTLRINAPVSLGTREIAPAIAEFCRLHPAITVELGVNDRVVDLIEEGWDVAIRIGRMASSTLIARRLAPCHTVVCAAPAYLAAHGTPRTIEDLKAHNCLGYTLPNAAAAERWGFGRDAAIGINVSGTLRANSGDVLRVAALAGHGVIYQPTFIVADDLAAGRLVALNLDHPAMEFPGVFAVYPPSRFPPAKISAFVAFLADRWAPIPPWDRALSLA